MKRTRPKWRQNGLAGEGNEFEVDPTTIIKVVGITAGVGWLVFAIGYGLYRNDSKGVFLAALGVPGLLVMIVVSGALIDFVDRARGSAEAKKTDGVSRPGSPTVVEVGVDPEGKVVVAFSESIYVENRQGLKMGTVAHGAFNLHNADDGGNLVRFGASGGMDIDGGDVVFTGFLFTQGATIKDGDGNVARHSFEPHTHNAGMATLTSNSQAFSKGGAY